MFGLMKRMFGGRREALTLIGDRDYTLKDGCRSVWITVGKLSVHIIRTDEGVVCDIYPLGDESTDSIASTYAFDGEGEDDDEGRAHDPGCAKHTIEAAECTCTKAPGPLHGECPECGYDIPAAEIGKACGSCGAKAP